MKSHETQIVRIALEILANNLRRTDAALTAPAMTAEYLKLKTANIEHEVFSALFLNTQNEVIAFDEMFRGTIDSAAVYPREVVKAALNHNAAAVIFSHNHPSGNAEPSHADRRITERLQAALELVDVRVLDHLVIGGMNHTSFAERGWL